MEHAPPRSFFPEGQRKNLITVPSCAAHNNDGSADVEYVRNILAAGGPSEVAANHFADKVLRSFQRSPGLLKRTLAGVQPAVIAGQETTALLADTDRFNSVMMSVVRALHFRDTGEKIAQWAIVPVSFVHGEEVLEKDKQAWGEILELINSVPLQPKQTDNPCVFQYSSGSSPSKKVGRLWIYDLCFYGGFRVKAFKMA